MQATRCTTTAEKDTEHKQRSIKRPAQGWSRWRVGSKRIKPTFKGSIGERCLLTKKSMIGKGGEKGPEGSLYEINTNRSRSKRRVDVGDLHKDTLSLVKQSESISGYRRGGQKQTWNVSKIPTGVTDLSRKKYSAEWLCQRRNNKILHDYIFELPETLSKQRLSPKSQERRYPFAPSQTSPPLRTARNKSDRSKDGAPCMEINIEFDNDNKQHGEKFTPMSTNLAFSTLDYVNAETIRSPKAEEEREVLGMNQSPSQDSISAQPYEKEKPCTNSNSLFTDDRRAFRELKLEDVVCNPGLRSSAGPISRPKPDGQVKERDKLHRFSNSRLKGAEREWLRGILKKRLRKYSVKPHELAIISKTISTSLVTDIIPLGYSSVPSPQRMAQGLTETENVVLSVQHEIRKMYNAAKLEAKRNAKRRTMNEVALPSSS